VTAVAVYCASSNRIDPAYFELAAAVGTELARRGYALVSGGGSVSMMGAVARAARAGGAHTVGVMPRALFSLEISDIDSDELVEVETMRERKRIMDDRADAFLVLAGGIGTLEEFFEVWTAATLGLHAKPVVVLDPDGFYAPLWAWLEGLTGRGFVRQSAWLTLHRVSTVDDAFAALEAETRAGAPAPRIPEL
jgi:uncharacterized protein (TIGR00730 family)